MRKLHVTLTADVSAKRTEGTNDADHGPKQAKQRRNHSDIGKVGDAIVQIGSDTSSFGLGNFADLLEISVWIFCCEIEDLLHNPGDGFAVTVGDSQ